MKYILFLFVLVVITIGFIQAEQKPIINSIGGEDVNGAMITDSSPNLLGYIPSIYNDYVFCWLIDNNSDFSSIDYNSTWKSNISNVSVTSNTLIILEKYYTKLMVKKNNETISSEIFTFKLNNSKPKVNVYMNDSVRQGSIDIDIELLDNDGDTLIVFLQYKDKSGTWKDVELETNSFLGTKEYEQYKIIWDSKEYIKGESQDTCIRIRVYDGYDYSEWEQSVDFLVNNTNSEPNVDIVSLMPKEDLVELTYTLKDEESDKCKIEMEYLTESKDWNACSIDSSSGFITAVVSSKSGETHSIYWDLKEDIKKDVETRVRLRAYDGVSYSSWRISSIFKTNEFEEQEVKERDVVGKLIELPEDVYIGEDFMYALDIVSALNGNEEIKIVIANSKNQIYFSEVFTIFLIKDEWEKYESRIKLDKKRNMDIGKYYFRVYDGRDNKIEEVEINILERTFLGISSDNRVYKTIVKYKIETIFLMSLLFALALIFKIKVDKGRYKLRYKDITRDEDKKGKDIYTNNNQNIKKETLLPGQRRRLI